MNQEESGSDFSGFDYHALNKPRGNDGNVVVGTPPVSSRTRSQKGTSDDSVGLGEPALQFPMGLDADYEEEVERNRTFKKKSGAGGGAQKKKTPGRRRNNKGKGRRKINIEYIHEKSRRQHTFSKRKGGLMKKANELSTLTGTQVLVLVASETGRVYTSATNKFQALVEDERGKKLIKSLLSQADHKE